MKHESTSDWERLFDKCATDEKYRRRLAEALQGHDDKVVVSLLTEIGVQGTEPGKRVSALRSFREPMFELAAAFDAPRMAG